MYEYITPTQESHIVGSNVCFGIYLYMFQQNIVTIDHKISSVKYHTMLHRILFFPPISSVLSCFSPLAITCGHPGNPANGRTNGSEFNLNDVVNFTCNRGYVLSGNARAQCRLNGQWSSPLPVCKGHKHEH